MSNTLKRNAAIKAVEFIQSDMIVGLGTGSTAAFAISELARKIKSGDLKNIKCIPTSLSTSNLATDLNIPLITFEDCKKIDITIDGADEVDENLNLIKGGGGALLREKVVAQASDKVIIIVDAGKLSKNLGEKWCVPIEVFPFAEFAVKRKLESLNAKVERRKTTSGSNYYTDQGNIILDTQFGIIENPEQLSCLLSSIAGIAEHGLFINLATLVISAGDDGIKILERKG